LWRGHMDFQGERRLTAIEALMRSLEAPARG